MKVREEQLQSRQQYAELMLEILRPLKAHYSPQCAGLTIGSTSTHYEDGSIPMEGFARPLWGLVPFWKGGSEEDGEQSFAEIYRKGIAAGTDPLGEEYWKGCRDLDQKFVEMASLSYGMLLCPERVWEPLAETEKGNLADWLNEINSYECSHSNWQFFCILTNCALYRAGMPYSEERLKLGLERIENYHTGGGWYRDGLGGQKDYYTGFAIQFYSVIYSMFMQDKDPERCERYRKRAIEFGRDFVYWFAEDGGAVAYGRSQTYRFAQAAFYAICIAAEIPVFSLPVMKGIVTRHLVYWLNKPIFDNSGILTIGYAYPNLSMSESYNAPGSPYWSMKVFAFLALPKEHPFWQVKAEPLPPLESSRMLSHADMIVQRYGGQVTLLTPGRILPHQFCHSEEKYSKFSYSSLFGFSIPRSQRTLQESAPDSVLSFSVLGHIFTKGRVESFIVEEGRIMMEWSPVEGITVKTTLLPTQTGHIREHEITSLYECSAYDAGFSVSIEKERWHETEAASAAAGVRNDSSFCRMECLAGEGRGMVLEPDPNTNLVSSKTKIPMIEFQIHKGANFLRTQVTHV